MGKAPVSEASAEEDDEEEEDGKEFLANKTEQEASGAGSGQLDHILESSSALESSVAFLQVQADIERRLTQQRMRKAYLLRKTPMQVYQVGKTRTRMQQAIIFPPALAPAFPTSQAQVRGTPTFQTAPTLAPVQRTCNTMGGVAATAPSPRITVFPGIFTLLEDRANTTPNPVLRG